MQCKLTSIVVTFEFEFSSVNGRIMTLDMHPYHPILSPESAGVRRVECAVNLPAQINLRLQGKNQQLDTLLDDQGNILADLFVRLNNLWLDNMLVPARNLHKIIRFRAESDQALYTEYLAGHATTKSDLGQDESERSLCTEYWGFNGVATLDLDQTNVFDQIMSYDISQI